MGVSSNLGRPREKVSVSSPLSPPPSCQTSMPGTAATPSSIAVDVALQTLAPLTWSADGSSRPAECRPPNRELGLAVGLGPCSI